jgi:hypothetical protein
MPPPPAPPFPASLDKNCQIYFQRKAKNTIISKIKTEQHDETYDLTSFMANPAAQKKH